MIWRWLSERIATIFNLRQRESVVSRTQPAPAHAPDATYQAATDGVGDLFHRTYRIHIEQPKLKATPLMTQIQADINRFVPSEMATFHEERPARPLAIGEEIDIKISGPWDGPVRVTALDNMSFTLVTREGHLEAGHIVFQTADLPDDTLCFQIESWATSRDKLVEFAYDTLGIAKVAQTGMWAYFCQQVINVSGGQLRGNIDVITERVPADA